jgi:hypothetical protein
VEPAKTALCASFASDVEPTILYQLVTPGFLTTALAMDQVRGFPFFTRP